MTAIRYTGGTARGEFRRLPPTGKSYVMSGLTIDKWQAGRIVEQWTSFDLLGALQQFGMIPEMARRSDRRHPGLVCSEQVRPLA